MPNVVFKHGKIVRFLHAAFDRSGDRFVAADHIGNLYSFDLHKNRYIYIYIFIVHCIWGTIVHRAHMGFGKFCKVMEIENAIFQESFGKERIFKMTLENFVFLFGKIPKIS